MLFGVGRDVRSVHAYACLVRVRLVKKDCLLILLRQPDVHKKGQEGLRRAGEAPRVEPETLDSYKNCAQAPCEESAKNGKQKCKKLEGNSASGGK